MTTSRSHVELLRNEEESLSSGLRRVRAELGELGLRPATFVDGTGHTTDAPPDILFAALEKTRMPMVVTDPALPDNPIVFVNRAFVDLSGYPPEEIVGRNCRFLQGPGTDREVVADIRRAIAERRRIATVVENHRKDGTTFQNELYISPVFSRDGELLYFFGSQVDVTKFEATQRLLGESEARYLAILDSTQTFAIVVTDSAGFVTHWNRGAQLILGWSPEDAVGERMDMAFTDEDRERGVPDEVLRIAEATGRTDNARWHVRKDGTRFYAAGETVPIRRAGCGTQGFLTVLRDTTDEHLTSEALKESASRLSMAMSAGRLGEWALDVVTDRAIRSAAHDRIFGYEQPVEDWTVHTFFSHVVDEDRAGLAKAMSDALDARQPWHMETRITRVDGMRRWVEFHGEPVLDEAGKPIRVIGVVSDVTARKEAERSLVDQNEDLEARVVSTTKDRDRIWGNSQDLLMVVNEGGVIEDVNPAFSRVLGWSVKDLVGQPHHLLTHADDHAAADRKLALLAASGTMPQSTLRARHADGSFRWIEWTASYDDGKVYAHGRDVTAEREQAEALAGSEEALRQSQKMEAVGQLTGGVAHDFNNLLTVIRSSLDLLRRPGIAEERKTRYLDAMSETVDRAGKLTGQLLAFSRRQSLLPEVFDVGQRLGGVGDMIDTLTGARISVSVEMPEGPCFVRADVSQFETALVNVAVNARDAMDGEGSFTLRLSRVAALPSIRGHAGSSEPFVSVAMTDTGCGIAADGLGRIFEPFFTTKEVGKGTGLGLSQVFGFAKQSGGDVDVSSTLGVGTTFTLYLPEVAADATVERASERLEGFPEGGEGRHVLVVEDNVGVGEFCTQILADMGFRTTWAANAEEALERLGADGAGFDAVFSDVVMPGMGGVALARVLRERMPDLPVLLTSGYSHVLAEEDDHGFAVLQKPYSADQLARDLVAVVRPTSTRKGA